VSPLPCSPVGPLCKEVPITRAFYINIRVPSNGSSLLAPFTECPYSKMLRSWNPSSIISEFPVNGTPLILNRAPVEKGAHFQGLLKSPVDDHPAKSSSGAPTVNDFHSWALPYLSGSSGKVPSSIFP